MSKPAINQLTVIGVGLIGGSLARALRRANAVTTLVGAGRNAEQLEIARKLGVVDRIETDLARACAGADVVVLAVPLGAMRTVLEQIAPSLSPNTVITDVGSAKGSVIADAGQIFNGLPARFVPGHPIAGTEQSGVEASFAELFDQRRVILTPDPATDPAAVTTVGQLWEACGAQVMTMDVAHHDAVLAATSHLPHVLAYTLVDSLARQDDSREIFDYAAGGFRDFTRIASSDPQMWHDICAANREPLVKALQRFISDLEQLTRAIEQADSDTIKQTFERAKQARDAFCNK
ncbi:prephenate dehydrogenase [Thiohalophilus sp.]|uniref:prephenate dehydrogenase n=1 Tax=Thiohalophilus sp. TaxID=3028392 RepID=UPI002ACD905E|nr:prephenate dehydrogenase/arogenate dehydrogenase family protein [Thiohalophilus sp.]MDZ7662764.1 prephenate dehydrogenase/arogenate dehydrogenase family protein [Thiohalophilus sp.]